MRDQLNAGNPALAVIRIYQRFLSPFIPATCRYIPTCSEYMLTAIQQHGTRRGLWLGIKRIGRCHPLGGHGYDPVPQGSDQTSPDNSQSRSVDQSTSQADRVITSDPGSLTGRKNNNG